MKQTTIAICARIILTLLVSFFVFVITRLSVSNVFASQQSHMYRLYVVTEQEPNSIQKSQIYDMGTFESKSACDHASYSIKKKMKHARTTCESV